VVAVSLVDIIDIILTNEEKRRNVS
jgi:hypothetical protein